MSAPPFPALIFAAGFGTRMQALTADRPKPLIPVAGKPLIDHALDLVWDAGCEPVVSNLHYRAEMLAEHLAPKGVQTVIEAPHILETGGGLRNAAQALQRSPVVTINSDAVWRGPNPIRLLQDAWDPKLMDALLICIPPARAVGHAGKGDFVRATNGQLRRGASSVYGGAQIIKTDGLHEISGQKFSLNVVWDKMLDQQRLYGVQYPGRWCDVGHPAGIQEAARLIEETDV
ncbi:MAG: nucleotidyltransferase family protein [Pseudomonadota bacterium]